MRGSLIAAIYTQTLETPVMAMDETAALTLMSADVERITNNSKFIHELWANAIQVAISAWLLQQELGVAFVVPIVITLCEFKRYEDRFHFKLIYQVSAVGVTWLSRTAGQYQGKMMSTIQTRIGLS